LVVDLPMLKRIVGIIRVREILMNLILRKVKKCPCSSVSKKKKKDN